jgi:DNA topoisomerase-2
VGTDARTLLGARGRCVREKVRAVQSRVVEDFRRNPGHAIDRNSLFPKGVSSILVDVDKVTGAVTITNNGPLGGIAVREHATEGVWNPELTFGHLLTSTNYDDTQKRIVGGRNGYGAKLANIYSTKFEIVIKDGENKLAYTQSWGDNMTTCNPPKIKKFSGATSVVSITFIPDWKRFKMRGHDE